jgi:hypothetical protein
MPGEAERGDASEALRSAPARDFADSYRVVLPAKVRVGFEKTSEDAGQLPVGDVVEALEGRPNAAGVLRIRTSRGWANTKAADGTVLLLALDWPDRLGDRTVHGALRSMAASLRVASHGRWSH